MRLFARVRAWEWLLILAGLAWLAALVLAVLVLWVPSVAVGAIVLAVIGMGLALLSFRA